MSNVSRHRPADTLEWFYAEWHGEHVDLMRSAPGLMTRLRRYVQNPALHDPGLPEPPLPLGPEDWDAMSQIHFTSLTAFVATFSDPDYIAKVRSHELSDPDNVITLLTEEEIVTDFPVPSSAMKIALFYQVREDRDVDAFKRAWSDSYPRDLSRGHELVAHIRNHPIGDVDDAVLVGSRWQDVKRNEFDAYDELVFADRGALVRFLNDENARNVVRNLAESFLSPRSFAFLCRPILQIDNESAGQQ